MFHALAEILASIRDEKEPSLHPGQSRPGDSQLEIYLAAGTGTHAPVPRMRLKDAKARSQKQTDAAGAAFGAIYFPTGGGSGRPGTGSLVFSYDRNVG